jgi:hypothetical protein
MQTAGKAVAGCLSPRARLKVLALSMHPPLLETLQDVIVESIRMFRA